ncbi:MAG TPA: type II toxin-antitoxin system PemK/MazF family toxin [Methylocella sp.]|nr:type II toxin-antitoxin system PemK/MazF family toxin [Methylocella sp.]
MAKRYVPEVGDIVWLNFTPQARHEQAGHRPALVSSPASQCQGRHRPAETPSDTG